MRGLCEWETLHGRLPADGGLREAFVHAADMAELVNKYKLIWHLLMNCAATSSVRLKRLPDWFISAFCSSWHFKSCCPLFLHLYESECHSRAGSFKCHKYCKHMIQPEPAVNTKATRRVFQDVTSPPFRLGALFERTESFRTGSRQLVPDGAAEWNTSLFEGSHSVDV